MKKNRIVILVDNPLRDLPACTLLAAHLAAQTDVFLTSTSQALYEIFHLQPDLVLLNYLRESNRPLVEKLIQAQIPFSVLDTEGGFFMNIPGTNETSFTMTLVKENWIRKNLTHYFCWGEDLAETLRAKKVYPEESVLCLGTPRMDFYHPSFRNFFGNETELKQSLIGSQKKVILINTSFAGNNPKFSTREKELEMLVSKFGYDRRFMTDFLVRLDEVMDHYIRLARFLAEEFPDVHFVLRPHPFENIDVYHKALENCSNVQVSCTNTVTPWLFISEALIHYECSTAAEAAMLNKPCFSLLQFKEIRPMPLIQSITIYADDFSEMSSLISQVLSQQALTKINFQKARQEIETKIYYRIDGKSAERISQAIFSWFTKKRPALSVASQIRRRTIRLQTNLRTAIKKVWRGQLIPASKKLDLKEVSNLCQRLEQTTGIQIQAHTLPLSTSLHLFKK